MNPEPIQLPLVDGAFLVDNSALELLACPRKFYYSFIRRRSMVAAKAGRNFGSAAHVGWAERYARCGGDAITPEAFEAQKTAMAKYFEENPQPAEDFRDLNHACRVMQAYNEVYKNEPFTIVTNPKTGKPIVEHSFSIPLCTVKSQRVQMKGHVELCDVPCYYIGKIDIACQDNHGIWAGPDHKTTFQFGDTFDKQMQRDAGQRGYTWALKQILGVPVMGYIIDAVRIRKPSNKDIFADKAPMDSSDFKRMPFFVGEEDLAVWEHNAIAKIHEVFYYASQNYWPEHESQCTNKFGVCDYFDVCSCRPSARENALSSSLYEDNNWSPLKRPENGQ